MSVTAKSEPSSVAVIERALAEPFAREEVRWKPQTVSKEGNKALAVAYVDSRAIQDRLDAVLGVLGWQDSYESFPDGTVVCSLSVRIGAEWITKMDVGSPSEQPDEGDRRKAAFSDALKRAAVKLGIGRYLYRLPRQWCDYDGRTRKFTKVPALPDWALPGAKSPPAAGAARKSPQPGTQAPAQARSPEPPKKTLPVPGKDTLDRIESLDRELAKDGLCERGELLAHLQAHAGRCGLPTDILKWNTPAIEVSAAETKAFIARAKAEPGAMLLASLEQAGEEVKAEVLGSAAGSAFPPDVSEWSLSQCKTARGWLRGILSAIAYEEEDSPAPRKDGEPCTQEELTELGLEMERAEVPWSEMARRLGLKKAAWGQLTLGQWKAAMGMLEEARA